VAHPNRKHHNQIDYILIKPASCQVSTLPKQEHFQVQTLEVIMILYSWPSIFA